MPFYSAHTASGYLINNLKDLLTQKDISSFALSKQACLSPTTTRKICTDERYIPSPDVLEKICLTLDVSPGDVLAIQSTMGLSVAVGSGVF
jgi:DNA-binding Xre family transcriptional regulator|tara:strand:+ start:2406 stop:2678 length:273 start_codon:yes stop_codon:yes gene_type:complete